MSPVTLAQETIWAAAQEIAGDPKLNDWQRTLAAGLASGQVRTHFDTGLGSVDYEEQQTTDHLMKAKREAAANEARRQTAEALKEWNATEVVPRPGAKARRPGKAKPADSGRNPRLPSGGLRDHQGSDAEGRSGEVQRADTRRGRPGFRAGRAAGLSTVAAANEDPGTRPRPDDVAAAMHPASRRQIAQMLETFSLAPR